MTGRPSRVAAAVLFPILFAVLGGCVSEQDPGVPPADGPAETSDTLGACPEGGPDATTPAAGCLDADGTVQRP